MGDRGFDGKVKILAAVAALAAVPALSWGFASIFDGSSVSRSFDIPPASSPDQNRPRFIERVLAEKHLGDPKMEVSNNGSDLLREIDSIVTRLANPFEPASPRR